jgi:hypothetical protein
MVPDARPPGDCGLVCGWSVGKFSNSVAVRVLGMELDPLLSQLGAATAVGGSAALSSLMIDLFRLVVHGSRGLEAPMPPAEAIQQLEKVGMGRACHVSISVSMLARCRVNG